MVQKAENQRFNPGPPKRGNTTLEYDVIGDIHGHYDELCAMLDELGYEYRNGAFRHSNPDRMILFLGDFIDRGPGQLETVDAVRRMLDAGTALAVMGNHEHGAIGWFHRDPVDPARYLREHGSKNRGQHAAFLAAVGDDRLLHQELVGWMEGLPLFLDLPEVRCIHACWHPGHVDAVRDHVDHYGVLFEDALIDSFHKGHPLRETVDILIRGPEVDLPEGFGFHDHAGQHRTKSRVRWWVDGARTLRSGAITDYEAMPDLPDLPLSEDCVVDDDDPRPVFFGHYWFDGEPELVSPRRTCLDFSVAKESGVLCAYTWRGEPELTADHLTSVGRRQFGLTG
jgi:hypothetical protein